MRSAPQRLGAEISALVADPPDGRRWPPRASRSAPDATDSVVSLIVEAAGRPAAKPPDDARACPRDLRLRHVRRGELARQRGDRVTGSDDHAYPPMSDAVTAAGIEWVNHSDPANLDRWGIPDLVVVGNQTRPANLELEAVRRAASPASARSSSTSASPVTGAADRLRHARQDDHLGAAGAYPRAGGHGPGIPPRLDLARCRRHLEAGHGTLRLRGRRVHVGAVGCAPEVPAHGPQGPASRASSSIIPTSTRAWMRTVSRSSSSPPRCRQTACWRCARTIPNAWPFATGPLLSSPMARRRGATG